MFLSITYSIIAFFFFFFFFYPPCPPLISSSLSFLYFDSTSQSTLMAKAPYQHTKLCHYLLNLRTISTGHRIRYSHNSTGKSQAVLVASRPRIIGGDPDSIAAFGRIGACQKRLPLERQVAKFVHCPSLRFETWRKRAISSQIAYLALT